MEALIEKLKVQIVEQLNLDDVSPEEIEASEPLFGEGLGLDSIDALELIVLLDKHYDLQLPSPEEGKTILSSVESMATFIKENGKAG